jgi:hypothetical protein
MEVYILDDALDRTEVVDRFESLIFTERYTAYGDFELVTHSTQANRSLFSIGTRMMINESNRVMTVETIENKRDSSGKEILTLKGRSVEQILEDRVATDNMSGTTINPNWVLTGTPAAIARNIFSTICVAGTLNVADRIPFLDPTVRTLFYTRPEPSSVITVELEHTTVYDAIKDICEAYELGFRLVHWIPNVGPKVPVLQFDIYTGNDRTTGQSTFNPVVFSHELDNLTDSTELISVENYKNVAYVFAKNGSTVVYAPGTDPTTAGFQRRVLMIKADDITDAAGAGLTSKLNQKGYEALAKARGVFAFDGETPQRGSYKYNVDYFLGDLVEFRNVDGVSSIMRVSEQIFVSDEQGDRSYPTLSVELTATPGSWAADDAPDTWAEATETWATS